jgi:branched-subunit amino acid aminotransferase/4-amino-4-deoxychorismate lyase
MKYISLNYQIKKATTKIVSSQSETLLYGFGLYETLKTVNQKPVALDLHIKRLTQSLKALTIPLDLTEQKIAKAVEKLLKKNEIKQEARIRITIISDKKPLILIQIKPLQKKQTPPLVMVETINSHRILPLHKSTSMAEQYLLSQNKKTFDCIYVNDQEELIEGTKSDIIYEYQNQIYTTRGPKLPSISFKLLEKALGKKISERQLTIKDLDKINSLWLLNSIIDIVEVDQVNKITLNKNSNQDLKKIYIDYLKANYG